MLRADRNFKGPFYTLAHVRYRLKRDTGVHGTDRLIVELEYDNLDRMRGVEVFLDFVPLASIEGLRRGMASIGVEKANQVLLYDELMDSNSLFLTGNTDTVYAIGCWT